MNDPGYTVELEGQCILVHMRRVLPHEHFDRMVNELLDTTRREGIKKFLLWTDVHFEDVDPARRMEGMRVAESFGIFDKVAVCATDPQELKYLEGSASLLKMGGFIKDLSRFKHFDNIESARAWIRK
jgi:hypothetical protein